MSLSVVRKHPQKLPRLAKRENILKLMPTMLKLLALALAISESAIGAVLYPHGNSHPSALTGTTNNTHCGADFCTWWHDSGEINTQTPVQPGNVRQSHKYFVQVSLAGANNFYDSFVYESIPRNGNGRIYAPTDPPNSNTLDSSVDDGISIEPSIGLNMAWSQFEYSQDVDIKILATDGSSLGSPSDVVIRPVSISSRFLSPTMTGLSSGSQPMRMAANFQSSSRMTCTRSSLMATSTLPREAALSALSQPTHL